MNGKRVSLNLIGQLISFGCSLGISFFLTPYIVLNLGEETYGFVGLANNVTSYITLFTVAINGMLSRYITIEYSKARYEDASGYFTTAITAQGILALILVIPMLFLAGNVEYIFQVPLNILMDVKVLWALIFVSFLMGLPAAGFGTATFAKNRLDIQAIINLICNIIRTITIVIAFSFFTPYVWYIGLSTIISNTVSILANMMIKKRILPEVKFSRKYFNIKYIYKLVIVGIWNSLNKLQEILYTGLDLTITNIFINASEMGILSIAKTLPTQISSLISMVSGTFDPAMTISYGKEDVKDFLEKTKLSMKICGFLCSVPILGVVAFGQNFYSLWMSALTESEVIKVQILTILTLFPQVFSVYIYPLYTVNTITTKLKIPVLVSIGIGLLNIVLVCILLKITNLGVYAVAGVSSFLWIFRVFLFVPIYAARILDMEWKIFYGPLLRGVYNVIVVGGVMLICAHFLQADTWLEFLTIGFACGAVGYLICFFIIFDYSERKKISQIIRDKFKS